MAFTDMGVPVPDERDIRDLDIPIEEITSMSPHDRFEHIIIHIVYDIKTFNR